MTYTIWFFIIFLTMPISFKVIYGRCQIYFSSEHVDQFKNVFGLWFKQTPVL